MSLEHWGGELVEIHGLDAPLEAHAPTPPWRDEADVDFNEHVSVENGERGRVSAWSDEEGRYIVETFDGVTVAVPGENLRGFQPAAAEEGGYDVVWPAFEDAAGEAEAFATDVVDHLQRKGWCMIQMFAGPGSREDAVGAALELVDWKLPKSDLEVQYMGHSNSTKYCELDRDDQTKDVADSLSWCDRCLTHLGLLLGPLTPEYLGFTMWGRHNGQVRMPFRASEETFLRPAPLSNDDYEAGGRVYTHLQFLERRRLKALYLVDNEGGEVLLHPSPRSGLEQKTIYIPISRGKLLLLLPDLMTYTYRPLGSSSVLLQTWYMTEPTLPNLADKRVVDLPPGQQGERAMVTALHTRYPGNTQSAADAWNMWVAGTDTAIQIGKTRFDIDAYYSADGSNIMYTNHFAGIDDVLLMCFDYNFFRIPLQEAEVMSPEQRNVLEVGYSVLVKAGYDRESVRGQRIGTFLGDAGTDYRHFVSMPRLLRCAMAGEEVNPYEQSGWQIGISCSRLAHLMDIRGPCQGIDTACSSSLVAMGQAVRSLVNPIEGQGRAGCNNHISKALIMGICLDDNCGTFLSYCMATMLSRYGRSFTFDETANGFLRGEGCGGGFVELGDSDEGAQLMLACVIGSNVNQDGKSASMTAPNGPSQQMCIKASMMEAGLTPSEITIAECHGTGTALGDPIEVGALRDIMKDRGDDAIIMTSGKANFGHMEANAGIGGISKCILMLQGMTGACNLHLHFINPHIEYVGYPAIFISEHVDAGGNCGISGVSSFGVGGTNARADLWARAAFGYQATTEVNTSRKLRLAGVAYDRVALHGQPGPGITDRIYVIGSWDSWSRMEELVPVKAGEFEATVVLSDTCVDRFRLVLNEDLQQTVYPVVDSADDSAMVLGPDWDHAGRSWRIDGRPHGARPGDRYLIRLEWDFSWDGGEYRRVTWSRVPTSEALAPSDSAHVFAHKYYVCGSWASFAYVPMAPVDGARGWYRASARLGVTGQEEFNFVRDRDDCQVIHPAAVAPAHPSRPRASDASVPVSGPDAEGEGSFWCIAGRTGEIVTLELRLGGGAIEVVVRWPDGRQRAWRSGAVGAALPELQDHGDQLE